MALVVRSFLRRLGVKDFVAQDVALAWKVSFFRLLLFTVKFLARPFFPLLYFSVSSYLRSDFFIPAGFSWNFLFWLANSMYRKPCLKIYFSQILGNYFMLLPSSELFKYGNLFISLALFVFFLLLSFCCWVVIYFLPSFFSLKLWLTKSIICLTFFVTFILTLAW